MADPVSQNIYQTSIPEELLPYAQNLLDTASNVTDLSKNPYQQYQGERVAQLSPLTQQAMDTASQMGVAGQIGAGSNLAAQAGLSALGSYYAPMNASAGYVNAPDLNNFQMGPAQQVRTQSFTQPGMSDRYMSPYMQDVVNTQQQEAIRQANIQNTGIGAQAARAGALGGGRQAIEQAQANRALQTQLGNIQAQGLQNAYTQGQQQFNTEQQNRLAAQQANQQAGLTTGQANLNALLGVQSLGAGQNLQAQQLNQAAQMQAQQQAEQSRQFGANYGLQGLATGLQAASTLGSLGQNQYQQQTGITNLQAQLGQSEQQQAQDILNAQYQDWANYQNYPYKQLGFMSDLIRGTPTTQSASTMYQAAPSAIQNLTSLGLGAYGINQLTKADGGMVKGYKNGGITQAYGTGGSVFDQNFKDYAVSHIDPRQLPVAQRNAMMRGDQGTAMAAGDEMALDSAIRRGIAAAFTPEMANGVVRAAGGGILAFAGDEDENDPTSGQLTGGGVQYAMGPANPAILRQAQERISAMDAYKPETLTPDQEDALWERYHAREQKIMGPNIGAQKMRAYLDKAETDRGAALEQGKGLAALEAAGAVLDPAAGGNAMRGLGAAGRAFAQSYGQALKADREEKRSLAMAGYYLADSERKERAGEIKSADASLAAHKASLKDANKFNFDKLKAQADATVKLAQASRAAGGAGGAGKGPKLNEQLAAAEIAFEKDPSEANRQTVTALRRANAQVKTTDVGATKADLTREGRISSEDKEVQKAMRSFKYDPAYLEARQAGAEEADRVWNAELERQRGIYRGKAEKDPAQDEQKTPAPTATRLQFDSKGNLLPSK